MCSGKQVSHTYFKVWSLLKSVPLFLCPSGVGISLELYLMGTSRIHLLFKTTNCHSTKQLLGRHTTSRSCKLLCTRCSACPKSHWHSDFRRNSCVNHWQVKVDENIYFYGNQHHPSVAEACFTPVPLHGSSISMKASSTT